MMNGKKSYLISFTALFSKKGYEVTFGIDQVINSNNWYHLTAPINSTYRTLIEDTMRSSSKVPHSATGLFGNLTNASNATEYEGFSVETTVASIVTYLSNIHKYFNGDTAATAGIDEQHSSEKQEITLDVGVNPMESGQAATTVTFLEDMESGDLYDVSILIEEGNRVTMSLTNKLGVLNEGESGSTGTTVNAQIDSAESFEYRLDAEEGRAVLSSILRQLLDGEISFASQAVNIPRTELAIEHDLSSGYIISNGIEGVSVDSAEIIASGDRERKESAERFTMDAKTSDYHLSDLTKSAAVSGMSESVRREVIQEALSVGLEEARVDVVYESQGERISSALRGTLEGLLDSSEMADTITLADLNETAQADLTTDASVNESLAAETPETDTAIFHSEQATNATTDDGITYEIINADTRKDAYHVERVLADTILNSQEESFTQVETSLESTTQEYVYKNVTTRQDGVLYETHDGELIQPVYNGMVEGVAIQSESVRMATVEESLSYDTRLAAELAHRTEAGTRTDGSSIELVATAVEGIGNGTVEAGSLSSQGVKGASVVESLTYETTQNAVLGKTVFADSLAGDEALVSSGGQAEIVRNSSVYQLEGADRLDVDYLAQMTNPLVAGELGMSDARYADTGLDAKATSLEGLNGDFELASQVRDAAIWKVSSGTAQIDYEARTYALTDSSIIGGGDTDMQLITSTEIYIDGKPLIERVIEANRDSVYDAVAEELSEAADLPSTGDKADELMTYEFLKTFIGESPEILKTVRLMEIMYGSKASDFIEAGINGILRDSANGEFTPASLPAITESVIEKMKQAGAGVSVVGSTQEPTQARVLDERDAALVEFTGSALNKDVIGDIRGLESGRSDNEAIADQQELAGASLYDFGNPVDVASMSQAILNANKSLGVVDKHSGAVMVGISGGVNPAGLSGAELNMEDDGVINPIESAMNGMTKEGEYPEGLTAALSGTAYDGESGDLVTAETSTGRDVLVLGTEKADKYDGLDVSIEHRLESASNATGFDGVTHVIERAEHTTDKAAFTSVLEGANLSDTGKDTVTYETTLAGFSSSGYEVHESFLEGATHREDFDTHLATYEEAERSPSVEAEVSKSETASHDTSTGGVTHSVESAYIDDRDKVGVIHEGVQADEGSGHEASLSKGTTADSGKEIGAIVHGGESADTVSGSEFSVIEDLDEATRKRKQVETDIEDGSDSVNNREPIITSISEPESASRFKNPLPVGIDTAEGARRPMKLVVVSIENPEEANRPKREIETVIERPEGGVLITPEEPKKPRIWLIIGKIASWNIWNWKKTR